MIFSGYGVYQNFNELPPWESKFLNYKVAKGPVGVFKRVGIVFGTKAEALPKREGMDTGTRGETFSKAWNIIFRMHFRILSVEWFEKIPALTSRPPSTEGLSPTDKCTWKSLVSDSSHSIHVK